MRFKILQGLSFLLRTDSNLPMEKGGGWELTIAENIFMFTGWIMGSVVTSNPFLFIFLAILSYPDSLVKPRKPLESTVYMFIEYMQSNVKNLNNIIQFRFVSSHSQSEKIP